MLVNAIRYALFTAADLLFVGCVLHFVSGQAERAHSVRSKIS